MPDITQPTMVVYLISRARAAVAEFQRRSSGAEDPEYATLWWTRMQAELVGRLRQPVESISPNS